MDDQLRKIGNYKFEQFEIIPLFDVGIEVVVDPKIVNDWPFPGWDGGDVGHTWLISAVALHLTVVTSTNAPPGV
jgi:hypothetical protein